MNILDFILSKKQFFGQQMEKERLFIYPTLHENDKALIKESYLMLFNYFKVYFGLSTYYFDSHKIRDISHKNSRAVRLVKNGSNLGKILFSIKEENKNNFDLISNSLITTVQEIEGIEVEETFGNYLIGFKERNKKPIPIQTVSDGTINFLATMTALNEVDDGLLKESFLLVFEEPERHLHLNAVNYMLQAFRESDKQIIITTHSTEIIKYADLKEVVFIYRDSDGDTQSIRADAIPNLEQKMKRLAYERDVTLDELIAEGMMGTFE
jgi:predicted ATPase